MKRAALVTAAEWFPWTHDDALLVDPLRAAGVESVGARWDDPSVDWPSFDAVVVRSTWDYVLRIQEFRAWIEARAGDGTRLWNPASALRWNIDKSYLRDLEEAGVQMVPTAWLSRGHEADLPKVLAERGWDRVVVKSSVAAGGHAIWETTREGSAARGAELAAMLAEADVLVQPFMAQVVDEGEHSFVFFGGEFSHALLKHPAPGGFLVHEKFGGTLGVYEEPPPGLVEQAAAALPHAPGAFLYARVDGLRDGDRFLVTELEVTEPELFVRLDSAAPERFVRALTRILEG